ncbi:MAG: NAD(P)/FAD-dependent oxidoreductase [Candidatus Daviesbacteria bacterium]|nr:NAD(P)/FAD-dependent oxidoreductase [Candidatus Daviesbacteria bacterium]
MHLLILGAGFTGLSAALRLLQKGHQVTIFEKEDSFGGLAGGFKLPNWDWTLEKAYHHWFTNDDSVLNLAQELNYPVIIKRPQTNVYINGEVLALDSPLALLKFPYLSFLDRLRAGLVLFYLRSTNNYSQFENIHALPWLKKYMGEDITKKIWEPLFTGKFGEYKNEITLSWFWARIKKRTPSLAYPEGGFKSFADRVAQEVKNLGGKIFLNMEVAELGQEAGKVYIKAQGKKYLFDKAISTLPSPIFTKITRGLPSDYIERVSKIPHLHALNLILILDKPFMGGTYWLNISDSNFPYLVLAEHTNFMDSKHYGNQHILYIGNYLPSNHPYLKMKGSELLKIFDPYLKKINPTYDGSLLSYQLFAAPFAQPVVTPNYSKLIPTFKSPLPNVYVANMDMVYPWDRGTNYAVKMGEEIARLVDQN